ncbi:MAG: hypothetical protein ACT4OH_03475 [Methylophilaceae bacterium]
MVKYHIFGDESIAGNIVVYALIIAPIDSIEQAEFALSKTKEEFGGSSSTRIHCKELLHEDARKYTEWAHLSNEKAWELVLKVKDNLANLGLLTRVGYAEKDDLLSYMQGVGSIDGMQLTNEKQLIPMAFYTATGQVVIDPEYAGSCKLWIDPNKDMIKWFNSNAQVGRLLKSNLVDLSNRSIDTVMTPENLASKEKPLLLDLADLLAYTSSRVLNSVSKVTKYKSDRSAEQIYKTMNPQIAKFRLANQEEAITGELKNFSLNIK